MTNEAKDQPESKFAEVIRKGKEKRAGMQQQSERRAQAKEESVQREEANRMEQSFTSMRLPEI
jgi:hypothetical protein